MATQPFAAANEDSYFGFGFQSAKGTGVAPTQFLAFVNAIELTHGEQFRKIREAGSSQVVSRTVKDSYTPGARCAAPIRSDLAGAIMAALLGADSIAGAGDPYTHTITKDGTTDWVTFEYNNADDVTERVIDGFFIEAEISATKRSNGPELMISAVVGGLDLDRQVAATAESYEVDRPYLRSDVAWTLDGTAETNVESATLRCRWTFDEAMLADSVIRANAIKIQFECEIEVVQLAGDTGEREKLAYINTHYPNAAEDGTGTATSETPGIIGSLILDATHSEGTVSEDTDRQFKVEVPVVRWTGAVLDPPNPESTEAVRLTRSGYLEFNSAGEDITVTAQTPSSAAYV